jgi:hypothetical protein
MALYENTLSASKSCRRFKYLHGTLLAPQMPFSHDWQRRTALVGSFPADISPYSIAIISSSGIQRF